MTDEKRQVLIHYLEHLEASGVSHLPRVAATRHPRIDLSISDGPMMVGEAVAAPVTQASASGESHAAPDEKKQRETALRVIAAEVRSCTRCGELVENRTQTVFGVGNVQPRLCFLGEAPGADEDRQGEPFVGAAGKLLNRIIAACGMERDDVYILNVVKCRPPGNRTPYEEEMANCFGYAERQLDILQPEFICCLGAVAVRALLKRKESIGKLRGKVFDYRASRAIVTYHPAYLLRNPAAKVQVWDDMKLLMREMGIQLAEV